MRIPRVLPSSALAAMLLAAIGPLWLACGALAEDITVASSIDAVTVFPTGAEIVRSFTVKLEPGEHALNIILPYEIQKNSIQIEGTSQSEVSITALDLRPAPLDTRSADAVKADLEARIAVLQLDASRFEKTEENAAFALGLVKTLAQRKLQPTGLDTTPPVPDPEALVALLDMVDGRLSQISETMLHAQSRKADAEKQIATLAAKLSQKPAQPAPNWLASVHVVAGKATSASFLLRYRLNSASWQPLYEARLSTAKTGEGPRLDLVRNAVVSQTTTEDWTDVALTLSTAQRTALIAAPKLEPQSIRGFTTEDGTPQASATSPGQAGGDAKATPGGDTTTADGAVGRLHASATALGFNALYAIPGRVTIDHSGALKTVRIGSTSDAAELFLSAVPKLDLTAYLVARVTVTNATPLLPGRVMLFRDGVFVGEDRLPLTAQGEAILFDFGADDLVTIERKEVARRSGETGLVSTSYIEERSYLTTVTSSHSFAIPIKIEDQVPVSDDERIRVDILQGTTSPDGAEGDGRSGIYSWTVSLKPNVAQNLRFGFRVTWPKGMSR